MKILITGGAGYIGSTIASALAVIAAKQLVKPGAKADTELVAA